MYIHMYTCVCMLYFIITGCVRKRTSPSLPRWIGCCFWWCLGLSTIMPHSSPFEWVRMIITSFVFCFTDLSGKSSFKSIVTHRCFEKHQLPQSTQFLQWHFDLSLRLCVCVPAMYVSKLVGDGFVDIRSPTNPSSSLHSHRPVSWPRKPRPPNWSRLSYRSHTPSGLYAANSHCMPTYS